MVHSRFYEICKEVINGTLCLYPSATVVVRYYVCEHIIGIEHQLRIPKDATIVVNSNILHRQSNLWSRSLEFDHNCWMHDPETNFKSKLPDPFAYLHFAAEPRNCIGQNFALLLEAKIM
ncbi:unnamed protein product [Rotaria sordida]|uniref:Cytochrome P450 n=2 Tax=Rotaria sordida TaxID=392033 RepID=A0A819X790_9BILA|nr:unnamed protein product [Rotaria sordida]